MSKHNPWNDIKNPSSDLSVRLVKGLMPLTLYWGKDVTGHCIFVLELEGSHEAIYRKNIVKVNGIQTDLRLINSTGNQGLVITLEKHVDQDLFYSLCETLISALTDVVDPAVGLSIALSQIKRWKVFMAGRKAKTLSSEEVRGLFAELLFLESMLVNGFSEDEALESWQGPEVSHQDFIYRDTAVEVKSLSGRERNTSHISSEDQLEGVSDSLFLKVYRLINMPESKRSISLNQVVKKLEMRLNEIESIEKFYEKLGKAGYVELQEYDTPKFTVAEEKTYQVNNDFPRIVRSKLPEGLVRIVYEIKLEAIEIYKCKSEDVWG